MPEPDYFLRYRMHCNMRNFITSGKSNIQVLSMVIRRPPQQQCMVLRRRKTVVGGKCALPSAILITNEYICTVRVNKYEVNQLADNLYPLQYGTSLVCKAVLGAVHRQRCGTEWLLFYLPIKICLLITAIISLFSDVPICNGKHFISHVNLVFTLSPH